MKHVSSLDLIIVILYMLALFVMAIFSARKIHSMEDYAVAGRNYPAWVIWVGLGQKFELWDDLAWKQEGQHFKALDKTAEGEVWKGLKL